MALRIAPAVEKDWRVEFLGHSILENPLGNELDCGEGMTGCIDCEKMEQGLEAGADESDPHLVPVEKALDPALYDYIALFIGADYCPHCKAFAPTVKAAVPFLQEKKVKTLFLSNDRTLEAYEKSCRKNAGIDVVPYNLDKTKKIRDLFELTTIPALLIFKNAKFDSYTPPIVVNGRNALVADPEAKNFPWISQSPMTFMDRFIIRGKYGKWWELGHHVNPDFPDQIYMDEHAVRARAGLLNIMTWIAIINVWEWQDPELVNILFPIMSWEFLTSMFVGLTPISPFGIVGTLMSIAMHPEPFWKPARPKRFAWGIGLFLSTLCFTLVQVRADLGSAYLPAVRTVVILCNLATWFESANGFCFGCFLYNTVIVPMYHLEECGECKL